MRPPSCRRWSGATLAPWKSTDAWACARRSAPPGCARTARWMSTSCCRCASRRCCVCLIRRSRRPSTRRGHKRRHASARALSADLAIHARAVVEVDRRNHSVGHRALRLRVSLASPGRRRRHRAHRSRTATTQEIRAAYLVGCDGGASTVRKELGIELAGEGNLLELRQALFRCDELFDRLPIGNGPGRAGTIMWPTTMPRS